MGGAHRKTQFKRSYLGVTKTLCLTFFEAPNPNDDIKGCENEIEFCEL